MGLEYLFPLAKSSIWFSARPIKKVGRAFNFILGGRGTGKTFSTISEQWEDNEKFILMRRTQTEVDLLASNVVDASLSPFKSINKVKGSELDMFRINKNIYGIRDGFDEEEAKPFGYVLALSTVSSIRGFDASDIPTLIFDEFIPQKNVKLIKDEGGAFLNAYETINRNREFNGEEPLKCYLLSNSNNVSHPLLSDLGLTTVLERMISKGQTFVDLPKRNTTITMIQNKDFREKKANTALYQLTKGTDFYSMALDNDFAYDDFSLVRAVDIKAYQPYCSWGDIMIYKHKAERIYYASALLRKTRHNYADTDSETVRFYQDYGRFLYGLFVDHRLYFESYAIKKKLLEVIA